MEEKNLWAYFISCYREKFSCFKGRARRKEFWGFCLFFFLFEVGLYFLLEQYPNVFLLLNLILSIPFVAVLSRRFHDVGMSGIWSFVFILAFPIKFFAKELLKFGGRIPTAYVVGSAILSVSLTVLIFYLFSRTCKEGDSCSNKYGEDPKGDDEEDNPNEMLDHKGEHIEEISTPTNEIEQKRSDS